jgi:cystathionine gamma-lyase
MRPSTTVVHAGGAPAAQGAPFRAGPTFASTYRFSGAPDPAIDMYGRWTNPTWADVERALGDLEGGPVLAFASGMAAIAAVLGAHLSPGDAVVLPSDGYFGTRAVAERYLRRWGIEVRFMPTAADQPGGYLDGAQMLWLETPSNPGLDVCDVRALSDAARAGGLLVVVDNTTATPLGQQPLALGADLSVCSDTKATGGHSDIVMGHVAARDPDLLAPVREWRTLVGAIPGPMEAWLLLRSLATLDLRLDRQCATALALAELLQAHPAVRGVRYPGLPSDPSYPIASRQMRRYGPIVGFELPDLALAARFLAAATLILEATSFGGVHTTAERRARWGSDGVSDGFIRLSV